MKVNHSFQLPGLDKKKNYIHDNFNIISKKYDLFNDLSTFFLHRLWKKKMVKYIIQKDFQNINCLDLCCGTGDISIQLLKTGRISKLFSVDFSEKMLEFAKLKLLKMKVDTGLYNTEIGDATNLVNFSNNTFDVVTIGFGLRNLDDLEKGLSEVYRVLKTGGIFINLDVGKINNPILRYFGNLYFFKIVPILGNLIWGRKNEMFQYLPESSRSYPDQKGISEKLTQAGFNNIQYKNFVFGNTVLHYAEK